MNRNIFQAVRVEYAGDPQITVSLDGVAILSDLKLPYHSTFRGRRVTLPVRDANDALLPYSGYIGDLNSSATLLQNHQFEAFPIENFSQQQLFHFYDIGFRTIDTDVFSKFAPKIYLDGTQQTQTYEIQTSQPTDTIRCYFNPLAYGYIPHIHHEHTLPTDTNGNPYSTPLDVEILWARPVALPPRFYRGIRTHAEFQITYKGDVDIEWYLDGISIGNYNFNSTNTVTEKAYFQSGTIGHVLQYIHLNPEDGGKIYIVETDVTLADLEQQAMRPQAEEG